jgi:4-amino-4-deoxy-L-arabinose transferase-like glycosyltransferase
VAQLPEPPAAGSDSAVPTERALSRWLDPCAAHWRWLTFAALLILAARGAWVRWELLTASPYPLGVDGYFYPIQLRSLLERGHLYYPASPLAFWLMAPLAALTDPITGAKLGAALGGAAVVWPAYALGKRLGGGRLAGLVAAVLAGASTGSLLLSAEFVKNAFGVTFGLAALAALLAALELPSRRRWALAAVALVAALLTHKMAMALVLVLGAPPAALLGWRRWPARRPWLVLAAALAAAALLVLGVIAPGRFLSLGHLELVRGLLFGRPRWDAPALAIGTFELPLGGEGWKAGLAAQLALVMLVRSRVRRRLARRTGALAFSESVERSFLPSCLIVVLGLLVALPTLAVDDPQGLGFRLRLIAFVPLSLCAALFAGRALQLLPADLSRGLSRGPSRGLSRGPARAALAARAALLLVLAGWLWRSPTRLDRGVVYAHPAMIAAVCALGSAVPPGDTVVVSERHIAFMATWYARVVTSVRPTAGAPARRWRLMPLAFIGAGSPLSRAIDAARAQPQLVAPRGLHPEHPNGLVLMPEATWQWVLTQLPPKPRRYYEAWRAL